MTQPDRVTVPESTTRRVQRAVASLQTWWLRIFVVQIAVLFVVPLPMWVEVPLLALWFGLFMVRPPHADEREPVPTRVPLRGRWVAINSPATKVPSHGVRAYGQAFAIDVLHPRGDDAPAVGWGLRQRRPEEYSSFGQPALAAIAGRVVAAESGQRDHRARSTWPGLVYMLLLEGLGRELIGARGLLGNHVIVEQDGVYAVHAHLRRGSVTVAVGDRVEADHPVGEVGNSGNTSEPHLHFHLMDRARPTAGAGIPFRWEGLEQRPGDVDPTWSAGLVDEDITPGLPATGQVFEAKG